MIPVMSSAGVISKAGVRASIFSSVKGMFFILKTLLYFMPHKILANPLAGVSMLVLDGKATDQVFVRAGVYHTCNILHKAPMDREAANTTRRLGVCNIEHFLVKIFEKHMCKLSFTTTRVHSKQDHIGKFWGIIFCSNL